MKTKRFLTCLLGSYFFTFLLLLLLALGMYQFHLDEQIITIGIAVIYSVSCFLGAFLLGKSTEQKKYLWGMLMGIAYYLILLGITWRTGRNPQDDLRQMALAFALCLGSGMAGGMIA